MADNQTKTKRPPDFTGWATKSGIRCTDGRTIAPGAFAHQDGVKVPLVWMHRSTEADNVLGHAILEDRAFGTYAQAWFNSSPKALHMKDAVENGDIESLSIAAGRLRETKSKDGLYVTHGQISELSLVIAGANEGAKIDFVNLIHSDGRDETLADEAVIMLGLSLRHGDTLGLDDGDDGSEDLEPDEIETLKHIDQHPEPTTPPPNKEETNMEHADGVVTDTTDATDSEDLDEEFVQRVFGTMDEEQRAVALYMAGSAYELAKEESASSASTTDAAATADGTVQHSDAATAVSVITSDGAAVDDGTGILAHFNQESQKGSDMNVFDTTDKAAQKTEKVLTHAQQLDAIQRAKDAGSFQKLFGKGGPNDQPGIMQHADVETTYGVESIDLLFPDATLDGAPSVISRRVEWVNKVLTGVKKQPFAKIKSLTFDITANEARARGYVKGTRKKDEVVKLLKRTTGPTTVYKKQKLDRDDILDITDFDIVVWLKWEIRFMLDEEIARAILIGDGRTESNPDKILDPAGEINGIGIRSIFHDHEMYAHPIVIAPKGNTETDAELAERKIEAITRSRSSYRGSGNPTLFTTDLEITDMLLLKDKVGRRLYGTEAELAAVLRVRELVAVEVMEEAEGLLGILVNLADYTVGANRGGELTFFSDFDIDFNQEKYLMETRISGALNKPKAAIVLKFNRGTAISSITAPSFADNTITIPTVSGVIFTIDDEPVTGDVDIEEDTDVRAKPAAGKYIADGVTRQWSYTYTE